MPLRPLPRTDGSVSKPTPRTKPTMTGPETPISATAILDAFDMNSSMLPAKTPTLPEGDQSGESVGETESGQRNGHRSDHKVGTDDLRQAEIARRAGQEDQRGYRQVYRDWLSREKRASDRKEARGHPGDKEPATRLFRGYPELGQHADLNRKPGEQVYEKHRRSGGESRPIDPWERDPDVCIASVDSVDIAGLRGGFESASLSRGDQSMSGRRQAHLQNW